MKVIWPFNPFKDDFELNNQGIKLLIHLFNESDSMEAVFVSSLQTIGHENIPLTLEIEKNLFYLKKLLKEKLENYFFVDFKTTALIAKSSTQKNLVKEMVNYSSTTNSDLIMLPNSKKTANNLNSFSKLLLSLSRISLLIYNQETIFIPKHPLSILYAHDFDKKCNKGLETLLKFVKKWNATLTIIHIPEFAGDMSYKDFQLTIEQKTEELSLYLRSQGVIFLVKTIYEIKPIYQIIIDSVHDISPDVVALTSQANRFEVFLGESISRKVFNELKIPMLIIKV